VKDIDYYDKTTMLKGIIAKCNNSIGVLITDELAEQLIDIDVATGELNIGSKLRTLVDMRAVAEKELKKITGE
jgi:hypothetical protein